ncbi:hypothetical protein RI367_008672 [Sorochytrium milnesiophthora]
MELYHVGTHCHDKSCNALDFLPFTCHHCKHVYCQEHWKPAAHSCPDQPAGVVVPVCPLCDNPVPLARGDDPNAAVDAHIRRNCAVRTSVSSKPVYAGGRCAADRCAAKCLVPVTCHRCKQNFCLKHRLEADHKCAPAAARDLTARAAESRAGFAAGLRKQVRVQ